MVPKLKAVSLCCWIFGAHKHCLVSWPSWKRGFNEHVITFRCSKGVVICGASAGTWCRTTLACPIKVISTKTLPRWHRVYYKKKKCDRLRGSCRSEMTATVKITQAIFCLFSERRRELSAVYISKRKWVELDIKKMGVYRKKIMNEGHCATYDITEDKVQTQTDFWGFAGNYQKLQLKAKTT